MTKDDLGDRMKKYEKLQDVRLMPCVPAIARIDGRNFHTFCKGLERPYDARLSIIMQTLLLELMVETCALAGYTQSDEISLLWYSDNTKKQIFWDGRVNKMVSDLSAFTSIHFHKLVAESIPEKRVQIGEKTTRFDARVFSAPTPDEAANYFRWRELDATRNSISMAAHDNYSPSEVFGKSSSEQQEMLFKKGINWNDYPVFFKRGVFAQRHAVVRPFTDDEIELLPEHHPARADRSMVITRSEITTRDLAKPFSKMVNPVSFLFTGENPVFTIEV